MLMIIDFTTMLKLLICKLHIVCLVFVLKSYFIIYC